MSPSTNNSSFNNSHQSSFCKTIKICKSKKEIQLTCMFSYKASWLQILTPWLQHAYLVTWKRGALMPTRTTIFFCSTSRSTRGRWQPVQVFFLVLSSTKPNTEECAPVFYRIFFRRFWASAEVKSSRWWIVSRNKWPFCGHFLNSLLPFQAWGSKLFFFYSLRYSWCSSNANVDFLFAACFLNLCFIQCY